MTSPLKRLQRSIQVLLYDQDVKSVEIMLLKLDIRDLKKKLQLALDKKTMSIP